MLIMYTKIYQPFSFSLAHSAVSYEGILSGWMFHAEATYVAHYDFAGFHCCRHDAKITDNADHPTHLHCVS